MDEPGNSGWASKAPRLIAEGFPMRWIVRIVVVLVVLWAAYFVWPYFGLRSLVQAVRKHDVAAVNEQINFPALRQSLTAQMIGTYLRLTGKEARLGQFRDLAVAATSSIADPIVAQLISAEALTDLLSSGWPTSVLPEKLPALRGLSSGAVGSVWQVLANSSHGLRTFSLAIPANVAPEYQFRLRLRLSGSTWKLYDVRLPEELLTRLTREMIRTVDKK
jgi:Protein of unknown function (DUF2939)